MAGLSLTISGLHRTFGPEIEHYVELALDCGRTNETELFAALAIDNAFPASHYTEPAFNSLVIKAAQLDLPLERVQGIMARQT